MPVYVPNTLPGAVDPADLIEQLGAEVAARYAAAEEIMVDRVARLVAAGVDVPEDFIARQAVIATLRAEGLALAQQLSDPAYVRRVIATAAAQGEAAAIASLAAFTEGAVEAGITGTAANALAQISLDLTNRLDDMSARITRWMPDVYQRAIALVSPNVILGVQTVRQAQATAASRLIGQGVKGFTGQNGAEWRIGTYAEMATRTSVNRAWQDANIYAMQSQGINLVSIIVGAGACKICAVHSGRIYSTDGTPGGTYSLEKVVGGGRVNVTVAGTLDQARAQGWNHPNCRCVTVAYLPGLSIAVGSRYDPEKEAARDRLRTLERRVRDLKRRQAATFDDIGRANLGRRIRAAQADIRKHVGETGLLRRAYREQLGFSDGTGPGPLPGTLPAPAPRPVTGPTPAARTPRAEQRALPAPAATPDVDVDEFVKDLDAARFENARFGIAEADTVSALAASLRSTIGAQGIKIAGFGPALSLESAKEFSGAIVDMLEKYPEVPLRSVTVKPLGAIARAKGTYGTTPETRNRIVDVAVEISRSYVLDDARDATLRMFSRNVAAGHFHDHPGAGMRYALIHEFGHLIDYTGQTRIRKEIAEIRAEFKAANPDAGTGTSGYGAKSTGELIAEAFADVETNGDDATNLSKRIHARMIEIYEEETKA